MRSGLPIDSALPALLNAIAAQGQAVLQAPPGAGKTTVVPLALMAAVKGRIVMLEPRRLAARAAAERMAQTLGETPGQTVGYRVRGESVTSPTARIEVITEGILTRMIQSDPELPGIGAVIFDEFHERSLHADLGLALLLEVRAALRPDLVLVVMSATLDAAPVAKLMGDAPLITSDGRSFPVETRWLPKPLVAGTRLVPAVAALIQDTWAETDGGMLVFLPGEGEIRNLAGMLHGKLDSALIQPLYGAMDFTAQRAALAPAAQGRKLVLATSIAETSLTIPDIVTVIDAGRARRARFDPGSGMSRLVTERVSRAEADQRRGRAGRVRPGRCYRLWAKAEDGALPAFPPPEIEAADLSALALELALWGSDALPFLTPPPAPALSEARALLESLGALGNGTITPHGRALARLPLHPRIGHMLLGAGEKSAPLAALLSDRDPLSGAPPDLALRLTALADPRAYEGRHPWPIHRPTLERIRQEAKRLRALAPRRDGNLSTGEMAALAYPDRIGMRRDGEAPRWVLSNGKGAVMDPGLPLSGIRLIVATDLDGDAREARVRQAVAISESEVRALFADQIAWHDLCQWSRRDGRVLARRQERLGALVLADRIWHDAPPEAMARAALDGIADELRQGNGWPMGHGVARLRARARAARASGEDIPSVEDADLLANPDWVLPALEGVRTRADLRGLDLLEPFRGYLGYAACTRIDQLYPSHFITPLGRRIAIDYDADQPGVELRLQELFGQTTHPCVGPDRLPLRLSLLSPGGKPIAVTSDLPGFWRGTYAEVRKDMRGRYPRHPWPEDPTAADPTLRAKPKGT
jgi:ATP-dependent helicase HrpB